MKITKLCIRNYRGIEDLDMAVAPGGVVAKGGNARGKSTVLKAIRSVLEARDVGADAIRIGTEKAEILIDLDDIRVRRAITPKASTLTVEKAGMKASKPTAFLKELLGTPSLDPLDLYLAKPKERRALILSALPVTVTREQMTRYAPDLAPDFSVDGHGLEVIERARDFYYSERTAANKDAEDAEREAQRLASEAREAAAKVTPGPIVDGPEASNAVAAASRRLTELEIRGRDHAASQERVAAQRDQVEDLRFRANEIEKKLAPITDLAPLEAEHAAAVAELDALMQKLDAARLLLRGVEDRMARAKADNDVATRQVGRVAELREQASQVEAALSAATTPAPTPDEVQAAKDSLRIAKETLERAILQSAALTAAEAATKAKVEARAAAMDAAELDATVKRLTNDAPSDLLSRAEGIPGLTLKGDTVLLDGKDLDALSDSERLRFSVEIARRANVKAKILVVDKLEALDEDQREAFVAHATSGDWQLFASLVTRGELQLVALQPDAPAAAAE